MKNASIKSNSCYQLSKLVNTSNFKESKKAILQLFDFMKVEPEKKEKISKIFDDIAGLYVGDYPGYRACDTEYHDFKHIMDVVIASLRITDALILSGEGLSARSVFLVAAASLLHDTGYILKIDDSVLNGAVYTSTHVSRSMDFAKNYLKKYGFSENEIEKVRQMILATDLAVNLKEVKFVDRETEKFAKILAAGDLLGQMADRIYLEKLLFLYREFKTGGIPYDSEEDLLVKTLGFFKIMLNRLKNDLDGLDAFTKIHFKERYDIDSNLYHEGMDNNIKYLSFIIENHRDNYRDYLRRDGIVDKIYK